MGAKEKKRNYDYSRNFRNNNAYMFWHIMAVIGCQEHKGKDRQIHEFAVYLIDNVRLHSRHSE